MRKLLTVGLLVAQAFSSSAIAADAAPYLCMGPIGKFAAMKPGDSKDAMLDKCAFTIYTKVYVDGQGKYPGLYRPGVAQVKWQYGNTTIMARCDVSTSGENVEVYMVGSHKDSKLNDCPGMSAIEKMLSSIFGK